MKKLSIVFAFLFSTISHSKIIEVYNTKTQEVLNVSSLIKELPNNGYFVLGEFHNTKEIQEAQAELIQKKVKYNQAETQFSVFWEFLDHTSQTTIDIQFQKYIDQKISLVEFISSTAGKQNMLYSPIIKVLKTSKGVLRGINLPRSLKQKVMKEGIQSIDPKFIPRNHYVGGKNYEKRFSTAMGGHVPADAVAKYFLAQCLTDSVMAEQITKYKKNELNFIIAGSFHTDFYDATVIRISKIVNTSITTFKFASVNQSTPEEIFNFKNKDNDYGFYADYIVISK